MEDFLTFPYQVFTIPKTFQFKGLSHKHIFFIYNIDFQPLSVQLRSQSFSCKSKSPRSLKGGGRVRGLQVQSQSFTFRSEREESNRMHLGQPSDFGEATRSKEDRRDHFPARRRLQELQPGDPRQREEGTGWQRLKALRRRLQERRRMQEMMENVETMTRQCEEGKEGGGWFWDELRGKVKRGDSGRGVRREDCEDDFEMREGRAGRWEDGKAGGQLMRSTSLTSPLSLRPAFARFPFYNSLRSGLSDINDQYIYPNNRDHITGQLTTFPITSTKLSISFQNPTITCQQL